jgi:uncharacterized membrane protein YoaK (UPF0700 family)
MRTTFLFVFALTIGCALSLPGIREQSPVQLQLPSSVRRSERRQQSQDFLQAESLREKRINHEESLMKSLIKKRKNTFIYLLAFVSGMADVACFKRFGFYASMMTGNTIRVGSAIVDLRWEEALFFGTVIVSYSFGASLLRGISIQTKKLDTERHTLLSVAPVALVIFCSADFVASAFPRAFPPILAIGFGLINAAAVDATKVVTNAVSGHCMNVGLGLADAVLLQPPGKAMKTSFRVLVSFLASIIVSSAGHHWLTLNPWVKLPPVGASFGVLYAALLIWYATSLQRDRSNLPFDAAIPRVNMTSPFYS